MTIAAAYLTSEGVVFGADSATTVLVPGQGGVVQLLNHAQKIFEVGAQGTGRIAVCTWGIGSLGGTSHRTVVARLADQIDPASTPVEDAAKKLVEIVQPLISQVPADQFVGYFVGGFDPGTHNPVCVELGLAPNRPPAISKMPVGQAKFSGAPHIFVRVFRGYDPSLPDSLKQLLKQRVSGLPADFDEHFDRAFGDVSTSLVSAGSADMPIREAIDYIHAYVRMTVKVFKFRFGPPVCGGPVEVGFITTDRPFRWVRHKPFAAAIIEQDPDL